MGGCLSDLKATGEKALRSWRVEEAAREDLAQSKSPLLHITDAQNCTMERMERSLPFYPLTSLSMLFYSLERTETLQPSLSGWVTSVTPLVLEFSHMASCDE